MGTTIKVVGLASRSRTKGIKLQYFFLFGARRKIVMVSTTMKVEKESERAMM